jgi:glyoxylate utilization-related uncharacterized protein
MATIRVKKFQKPDELRSFIAHGQLELLTFGGLTVGRATFEPGWVWAKDVGPIAGTKSCEAPHCTYVVSGRMRVIMDGGSTVELSPGDVAVIPPGHHAEVLGDEACVCLDFNGMSDYARPVAGTTAAQAVQTEARH